MDRPTQSNAHARGNPYSAIALASDFRVAEPLSSSVLVAPRRSRFPWWLNPAVVLLLVSIRTYQLVVPDSWKRRCIYRPTCSRYAVEVLKLYGVIRGLRFAAQRIGRCDGVRYAGGSDPAPLPRVLR